AEHQYADNLGIAHCFSLLECERRRARKRTSVVIFPFVYEDLWACAGVPLARLKPAATAVMTAASSIATIWELLAAALNTSAARAAPMLCPIRRFVPIMPDTVPVRFFGAAATMERMLGGLNNPKPKPDSAMRHTTANSP